MNLPAGVDGVVAFPHGEGCGHAIGPDTDQLRRTLGGVLDHPNVAGAIILGLGCEVNQIEHYLGPDAPNSDRLVGMTVQGSGGTRATVEAARRAMVPIIERAAAEKRVELPASKIVLGLNCGGSDSFSGITANPALGYCSDLLAEIGATAVLAETTEIFGAEHLLVKRARNRETAERLLSFVDKYKKYLRQFGGSFDDNPSPGNKAGGLTNILEKSLGAVAKAGTSPLMQAVDYAERVNSPGFVFMNTPGYDPASLTGLGGGWREPDRVHDGPRKRYRISDDSGHQDLQQFLHLRTHAGQHGRECGPDRRRRCDGPGSRKRDLRPAPAGRIGRADLRRAPGPQRIRAVANRAGPVMAGAMQALVKPARRTRFGP